MFGIKLTKRLIAGLALIYASGLAWIGEIILSFSHVSHKGMLFTGVLITAETLFLAGIAVLGRPLYRQLRSKLLEYIKNRGQ